MQALNVGVGDNEPVFTVLFENEKANSAALQQYAGKIQSSGVQSRRSLVHKSSRGRSGAAFLASAAALVVLIFLCTRGQKRWDQLAAYGRQLSEDDDSRLVAKRSWCSDSGGEADISSDDDTTEMPPMLKPLAKRARAEAESDGSRGLSNVDAGVQQAAGPSSKGAIGSTGATARRRLQRRVRRRPSASKSKAGQLSAYEPQGAAGLHILWAKASSVAKLRGAGSVCCSESGTSSSVPLSERELQAVAALHQLGELTGSEGATGGKHDEKVEDEGQPSTSAVAGNGEKHWLPHAHLACKANLDVDTFTTAHTDLRFHPFCRLPLVDSNGITREFMPEIAVGSSPTDRPLPLLSKACELLAKAFLSPEELDAVSYIAERLIAHAVECQTRDLRGLPPHRAIQILGVRFLIFDIIVSAVDLLGQRPEGSWWEKLSNSVPHFYGERPKGIRGSRESKVLNLVAQQLSAALKCLKSGIRPSCTVLISLKQFLTCSPYAPPFFKQSSFDSWRKANNSFVVSRKGVIIG
ncbi:hypothetical protein ETH_00025955 [Eimeria tenella]|uniref:Uncharacterized protein n=1 Tax=Eimeria tenella TaxID=5802 RepID=U6KYT6_EIMTE|nr:hypothetical protein ETH_00025955 [Eimeria tenella]CDJ43126.1 hypothetical protein ETH_00025955 [Eimeria tenella]|eukprot:XP_013233876.1 hypothetical protein ETH_00025955 [Eimeria tenella]